MIEIKLEIAFWACMIIANIYFANNSPWIGFAHLVLGAVVWVVGYFCGKGSERPRSH